MRKIILTCLLLLAACAPAINPSPTPQVISVYASPATQTWLSDVYKCAQDSQVTLAYTNDPALAQIAIRMGEPVSLQSPAYQIGSDDLLILTHPESPLQNLTMEQAQTLFSNPGATTQLWVFASGEDIQQVFIQDVMRGAAVASLAHLALSPQQMSDALNKDKSLVGILPRRWDTGVLREIFSLPDVPVLAQTQSEPQGALKELLACLQKRPAQ